MSFLERMLSLFGLLTQARHEKLMNATVAAARQSGREEGEMLGFAAGVEAGKRLQQEALLKAASEEEAERALSQAEENARRARWVVSSTPLPLTEDIAEDIRSDVIEKTAKGDPSKGPTADQWKMILSNCPATYVIAGAGSGKSTSLVLRVIALNQYLDIPLDRISVFTFTKASRADFATKLRKRFADWGRSLTEKQARQVVRTFHSMVLRQARGALDTNIRILEILDMGQKGQQIDDTDVENLLAENADLPSEQDSEKADQASDLTEHKSAANERIRLLRLAYEDAFSHDKAFRENMLDLYRYACLRRRRESDGGEASLAKNVAERDEDLTAWLDRTWGEEIARGLWPVPGVEPLIEPVDVTPSMPHRFWFNGFIPELNAYVALGGANLVRRYDDSGKRSFHVNAKGKLLAQISDKPFIWIDSIKSLTELRIGLRWLRDCLQQRVTVPAFSYTPPGEIKGAPVVSTLAGFAEFIENIGLDVAVALTDDKLSQEAGLSKEELTFAQATRRFWQSFEKILKHENVWTFNQLFSRFSEDHPENFADVPRRDLLPMQHLLIDEFQDISPRIVKWIRGCQKELIRRNTAGTLMCVGDDWQSIYGWRGSSPDFFLQFERHFPASEHLEIKLEENFRSSHHVVRCAETILENMEGISSKKGKPSGVWANCPYPVIVKDVGELPYDEIRSKIDEEVERTRPSEEEPLLVLCRSRTKDHLAAIGKNWGKTVAFMTMHGSKGLESRSVFLLGDCHYTSRNRLKNFAYKLADLGTYDAAQEAEALRVAYVGITRAMERCHWYGPKKEGGAMERLPEEADYLRRTAGQQDSAQPPGSKYQKRPKAPARTAR